MGGDTGDPARGSHTRWALILSLLRPKAASLVHTVSGPSRPGIAPDPWRDSDCPASGPWHSERLSEGSRTTSPPCIRALATGVTLRGRDPRPSTCTVSLRVPPTIRPGRARGRGQVGWGPWRTSTHRDTYLGPVTQYSMHKTGEKHGPRQRISHKKLSGGGKTGQESGTERGERPLSDPPKLPRWDPRYPTHCTRQLRRAVRSVAQKV